MDAQESYNTDEYWNTCERVHRRGDRADSGYGDENSCERWERPLTTEETLQQQKEGEFLQRFATKKNASLEDYAVLREFFASDATSEDWVARYLRDIEQPTCSTTHETPSQPDDALLTDIRTADATIDHYRRTLEWVQQSTSEEKRQLDTDTLIDDAQTTIVHNDVMMSDTRLLSPTGNDNTQSVFFDRLPAKTSDSTSPTDNENQVSSAREEAAFIAVSLAINLRRKRALFGKCQQCHWLQRAYAAATCGKVRLKRV